MKTFKHCSNFLFAVLLIGCSSSYAPGSLQLTKIPPSQLRVIQTKQFNQTDQTILLQSVMKALASLDFQIVRIDAQLGLVEAMQLDHDHIMEVNVVVEHLSTHGTFIRMNARYNQYPVEDANVYQRFFETLSRNIS